MSALRILIDRYCEGVDVIDPGQLLAQLANQQTHSTGDAWRAWLEAKRAERATRPELALAWVRLGERCLAEHPDPICELELVTLNAHIHNWLDEPRDAIGPADAAWRRWAAFAGSPLTNDIVPSMWVLLGLLSEPHPPPELGDAELYVAWTEDRLLPQFECSARLAMSLFGDLHDPGEAQAVADAHAAWGERWLTRVGTAEPLLAASLGSMALTLGDVYERCGDIPRALAVFSNALDRIEKAPLPGNELVVAQLQFNHANQLSRLRRWAEAEGGYAAARDELSRLGEREAVLRIRYAVAHLHYMQSSQDPGLEELASLAVDYEEELRAADSAAAEINTRQGLDRVYRLWARVLAGRFEARNVREVQMFLLLLFALKEEEGKIAGLWRRLADHPDATVLSEISVLMDRIRRRPRTALLIVEQVVDALLIVTYTGGTGPWYEHVHVAMVERAELAPLEKLVRVTQTVAEDLADRRHPVVSDPGEEFETACRQAWLMLPTRIRADLSAAEIVLLTVDFQTDLDLLPVELLHDGTTYLGLRAGVVQAPSLRDMNALLGENQVNAAQTGTTVIVRTEDELPHADEEVSVTEDAFGGSPGTKRSSDPAELLNILDDGADLLHYAGHGLADKIGEELPLGPGKSITARDIAGLHRAPAPVTALSACLAGRGRQLRTGEQQGFATALLRAGAPAVLAAKYLLPNHITTAFWSLFYYFANEMHLEQAVLETRRALAAKGHHPAAWSCFVLFGRPGVSIRAPHRQAASVWPSHVFRYLATGSAAGLAEARALLARDDRLTRTQRGLIDADLVALHTGVAAHFGPEQAREPRYLDDYAEAAVASAVIGAFGILRTADDRPQEVVQNAAGTLIATEPLLYDTYLLLAAVAEIDRHLMTYVYQEGRPLLFGAARRLRWLTADDDLTAIRAEIEETAERVRRSFFLDLQSIAGVDVQTFRDADAGDRGAQNRMLRNLMIRNADPRALLTPDWTPWLLRAVGASTHQALSDALGAIDQAGRDHRITSVQRDALVRLIEQFGGPGAVDANTAATAVEAVQDTEAATALDLFLLHDAVASGETEVGLDQVREGAETADALGATGAAAYFRGVWAQHAANDADLAEAALDEARAALAGYTSLVGTDPVYLGKRAVAAVLVAQLAAAGGNGELTATATATAVADIDGMLATAPAERTEDLNDNLVAAAVHMLAAQGDVAAARALLGRAGDRLGQEARDRLDGQVGSLPSFPDDPDSIAEQGSQRLHDGALIAAVEWLGEARRRYQEAGQPERCCGLLGDLAVALRGLGNRAAAVRTYEEAIAFCSCAGDDTNLSRWSQNLALLYAETGARAEARALLEEGHRAAERSGNSYQVSAALGNLGKFLAEEDRYSEAIDYFDDAIARTEHAPLDTLWRRNRAEVVRRWVDALIDANDVARAAEVLREANGPTRPADKEAMQTIAWTWLRLAAAQSKRYRPQQAAESAGQAVTMFEEIGDPESTSLARQARDEV